MNDELIIKKMSELIKDGHSISNTIAIARVKSQIYEYTDIKRFQTGAENILRLRFGNHSEYYKQFLATYNMKFSERGDVAYYTSSIIQVQTGILEAVSDALKSGLDYNNSYSQPCRAIKVSLLDSDNNTIATDEISSEWDKYAKDVGVVLSE